MRIARVMGNVTLGRRDINLPPGSLLLVEVLDSPALTGHGRGDHRRSAMPEALVVFDELGAGRGQLIAISEGGEAMQPFRPKKVPCDAYNAAILDDIYLHASPPESNGTSEGANYHANL